MRKEEKSHILWWLYPLGSVPETLVAEQTAEPSGDRGRELGAQRGGPGAGGEAKGVPRTDHRARVSHAHLQLPPVLPQVAGLQEREAGLGLPSGAQSPPCGGPQVSGEQRRGAPCRPGDKVTPENRPAQKTEPGPLSGSRRRGQLWVSEAPALA